jgi:hypothetical protein
MISIVFSRGLMVLFVVRLVTQMGFCSLRRSFRQRKRMRLMAIPISLIWGRVRKSGREG